MYARARTGWYAQQECEAPYYIGACCCAVLSISSVSPMVCLCVCVCVCLCVLVWCVVRYSHQCVLLSLCVCAPFTSMWCVFLCLCVSVCINVHTHMCIIVCIHHTHYTYTPHTHHVSTRGCVRALSDPHTLAATLQASPPSAATAAPMPKTFANCEKRRQNAACTVSSDMWAPPFLCAVVS